jgi:hypothetical protein
MTKRVPIRVLKKPTHTGRIGAPIGNNNTLVTGIYADLGSRNLDGRSKLARAMRAVKADLTTALGNDPSPQERILIDRCVYKLFRVTLFEAATLAGEKGADEHYLAWSNSLRLDLLAIGLDHMKPKPLDLASYMREQAAYKSNARERRSEHECPDRSASDPRDEVAE